MATKDEALKMRKEQDEYWSKIIKQAEEALERYAMTKIANTHPAPSCDKVTRLEVIDNNGRTYVNWGIDKMEFSYQDDGRTLKIFTNGSGTAVVENMMWIDEAQFIGETDAE